MSVQHSSSQGSKAPRVYSLVADGRRIVHSTFPDGSEMIEEYDIKDDCLLVRKARKNSPFGKQSSWEYEVGSPPTVNSRSFGNETLSGNDEGQQPFITPAAASPFCVMLDTKEAFQWRIRNLPYPLSTYSVTIDEVTQEIVVRTTNKKYFKRLAIKTLKNVGVNLDAGSLTWTHQHNTLILTYLKPEKVGCRAGVGRQHGKVANLQKQWLNVDICDKEGRLWVPVTTITRRSSLSQDARGSQYWH